MKRNPKGRKTTVLRNKTIAPRQPDSNLPPIEDGQDGESELGEDNLGPKEFRTPDNLDEELPVGMLLPKDPQAPKNFTFFHFKERAWKKDEIIDQLTIHFALDGDIINKESNEFKIQDEINDIRLSLISEARKKLEREDPSLRPDEDSIKRQLRNKFNYSERQTQTINEIIKEIGVSTIPPDSKSQQFEVNQADIFDAYMEEFAKEEKPGFPKPDKSEASLYSASFKRCLKIMERMAVLNDQQDRYHEYKYFWTGETADLGKTEGAMLPIWRFTGEKQKKRTVTSVCWNPAYTDLFAVGLGSYEFLRPLVNPSMICIYSLKNTTFPEYTFTTECGVMSIDFHPAKPALLAVGLYDGTVQVYDIRNKFKKPIYQSSVRTNKHTDPAWQVKWNPDTSKGFNFYSISSDGRVTNWTLMKNKLEPEEVIKLKLVGKNADEESSLIGSACGLCFDFNKFEPHLFLVGTEEGKIHRCSRAFAGQYLDTYEGHLLAVYKVKWNHYHNRTFISASADWTVKIWDYKYTRPVMSFNLDTQVVDAVWAPYSSTVFAAATLDKVSVFDLKEDKYQKLADQKPVKHPKLTNLAFNQKDPILLVGDTHGGVTLVKLSPNLTKGIGGWVPPPAQPALQPGQQPNPNEKVPTSGIPDGMTFDQFQHNKMEVLLKDMGKVDNDD